MYIFPHPDDESFGPAGAIDKQIKEGNKVILLTLTKGGATKVRHKLGLSIEEMGIVRAQELQKVQQTLGISELTILDYPDGGLAKHPLFYLEADILKWLHHYQPNIVITYPVHGGSGHHDHITLHHIIKRLFFDKKDQLPFWKRLAYFTVIDTGLPMFFEGGIPRVTWTKKEDILVTEKLDNANIQKMKESLLCYDTYQEMVKTTNVIDRIGDKVYFELENEKPPKMLSSITELINELI